MPEYLGARLIIGEKCKGRVKKGNPASWQSEKVYRRLSIKDDGIKKIAEVDVV